MDRVKTDYSQWLRQRAADAQDEREAEAPISLTAHKARQDREKWKGRVIARPVKVCPDAADPTRFASRVRDFDGVLTGSQEPTEGKPSPVPAFGISPEVRAPSLSFLKNPFLRARTAWWLLTGGRS